MQHTCMRFDQKGRMKRETKRVVSKTIKVKSGGPEVSRMITKSKEWGTKRETNHQFKVRQIAPAAAEARALDWLLYETAIASTTTEASLKIFLSLPALPWRYLSCRVSSGSPILRNRRTQDSYMDMEVERGGRVR